MTNDQTQMKNHFCPVENEWIGYKGECNWCGEKETEPVKPAQRKPLTDQQLETMAEKYVTNCYFDTLKYARAIEAAHGIKKNI